MLFERLSGWRPLGLAIGLLLTAGMATPFAQQSAQAPKGEAAVTVTYLVIPFFAVDESEKPLYTLTKDDLEVMLSGKPVPIVDLKGFPPPEGAARRTQPLRPSESPTFSPPARHVFLIFDVIFTTPTSFLKSKLIARDILIRWPHPRDRFTIVVLSPLKGAILLAVPRLTANEAAQWIPRGLNPKWALHTIRKYHFNNVLDVTLFNKDDYVRRRRRNVGSLTNWVANIYTVIQTLSAMDEHPMALVFTRGVMITPLINAETFENIYTQINTVFSSMGFLEYATATRLKQKKVRLRIMTMFINPDAWADDIGSAFNGNATIHALKNDLDAVYLKGMNRKQLARRIADWTSAYYELTVDISKLPKKHGPYHLQLRLKGKKGRIWTVYRTINQLDQPNTPSED